KHPQSHKSDLPTRKVLLLEAWIRTSNGNEILVRWQITGLTYLERGGGLVEDFTCHRVEHSGFEYVGACREVPGHFERVQWLQLHIGTRGQRQRTVGTQRKDGYWIQAGGLQPYFCLNGCRRSALIDDSVRGQRDR